MTYASTHSSMFAGQCIENETFSHAEFFLIASSFLSCVQGSSVGVNFSPELGGSFISVEDVL